jgi:hypothetical protein
VGTEDASVVLQILGREITVHGFTITGGRNGMTILRGASAIVDGNTIENSGAGGQPGSGLGINVGQHSFASITNNTIRNHRQIGILVHERSSARIGFFDVAAIGAPNLIENNAGAGIQASRGSTIRVVATTIRGNSGDGILVERGSEAEVANNEISGNGGSAIAVVDGSGLDVQIGAATETAGNRTAAGAPNGAFGIQCTGWRLRRRGAWHADGPARAY